MEIDKDNMESGEFKKSSYIGETRYLRAEEFAHLGHWEFSLSDNVLISSDEMNRIYGYNPKIHRMTLDEGARACHPDDLERVQSAFSIAMENGNPFDYQHRIVKTNGEIRTIHAKTECERDENGQISSMFGIVQDITDQKNAEDALYISEARLSHHIQNTPLGSVSFDHNFNITEWNKAAENIFGFSVDEVFGLHVAGTILPAEIKDEVNDVMRLLLDNKGGTRSTNENLTKDGRTIICDWYNTPIIGEFGKVTGVASLIQDITERKQLEEQLRHSQRLEAVGQLTGGIAHDFNNLLAVMIGNAEMLLFKESNNDSSRKYVETIITAVDRASSLTDRLLAFSRQQVLSPIPSDVSSYIGNLVDMLQRTLGETIDLKFIASSDLWSALIDPHQFENALVNLALNARDAMPQGGSLTIEATNSTLDNTYVSQYEEVEAGEYVKVAVIDNGTGMASEVIEKVFEPFYTTKDIGQGSGLGLSMVFGFAKQSNGHVTIYSEEGHGTTVKLYMPRSNEVVVMEEPKVGDETMALGSERILVVEDDANVREISVGILSQQGYEVIEVDNGNEAIEELKGGTAFDLLFTDVILPGGINGVDIAKQAVKLQPSIKVLYTTGYAENSITHNGRLDDGITMVNKPYRRAELLEKVRTILDEK